MIRSSDKPLVIFFFLSVAFVLLIASVAILDNYELIDADIPVEPFLILGSWTPNIAALSPLLVSAVEVSE